MLFESLSEFGDRYSKSPRRLHSLFVVNHVAFVLGHRISVALDSGDDHLLADFLLIKTDKRGNMLWNQTYPGQAVLGYPSLIQTLDGGFALSGAIGSLETGDYDFWLIKTEAQDNAEFPSWTLLLFVLIAVLALVAVYRYDITKRNQKRRRDGCDRKEGMRLG